MVLIEVIHGKDPQLQRPRFLVDNILKKDVPKPYDLLVNGYKFIVWIGRPQSGKTSHLFSLFKDKRILKKCWNHIIVCMPIQSLQSIHPKDNIFKDVSTEKFYSDLGNIDSIREQVKYYASQDEDSCILIDDMMSSLKDSYIEKGLADIVANRRHYRCSVILCSQLYERIPLRLRKLINVAFIMYKPSKREIQMVMEELIEQKSDVADEIFKIAFKKQYDWLMLDVPEQKIYNNYNQLIIKDEQDTHS